MSKTIPGCGRGVLKIGVVFIALSTAYIPLNGFAETAQEGLRPEARVTSGAVSALGRLEPKHGIMRIAAPSTPQSTGGALLKELLVEEGENVSAGQLLAVTDTAPVMAARLTEVQAELKLSNRQAQSAHSLAAEACVRAGVAERESTRRANLYKKGLAALEETETAQGEAEALAASCVAGRTTALASDANIAVATARVAWYEAQLERSFIRAPVAGRILDIHARPGEFVQSAGILELGMVDQMYAIAEVYETDIRRVRIGQKAEITSDALDRPLTGIVELIRLKIQKQDEIGTDPAADKDARIVEVEIPLDDSGPAASLTNLQVEIVISP